MRAAAGELDILGIGNAIVDVLAHAEDEVIQGHGLPKGSMTLIDAERADALDAALRSPTTSPGGSCANTVAAAASFGSEVAYIGKVCADPLGESFTRDIRAAGVRFGTAPLDGRPATARSVIMVSPDGQRTMSTYLGACAELGPSDIDPELVGSARVTCLEGYLWDQPRSAEACNAAIEAARANGRRVALTLSDTFCVERHREEFLALVEGGADVLLANEGELCALFGTENAEEALERAAAHCPSTAVTRGPKGSVVSYGDGFHEVPAEPVAEVVDTTGAGDAYAAGFLHGLARGLEPPVCARLGSIAAAEVISHVGARPQVSLAELAAPALEG
ncbi:adenosine kinase [Streptomyces sp. ODS28]|uniref:adenosine kinase n=1 Tax=Streptomyces sp. ODS28 TaxID=3136688 RepID=UPI0031EC4BFB